MRLPKLPPVASLTELFDYSSRQFLHSQELAKPYVGHFHEYIVRGGFPQTAQVESITQAQRLLREDIIDKVLKRDMTALFGVRRILDLEHTFLYLCMHDGGLLDMPALCSNLEVKLGDELIPFEVKYRSEHAGARELKGLVELCADKRVKRGYVVTKSLDDFGPFASREKPATKIMRDPRSTPLLLDGRIGGTKHIIKPDQSSRRTPFALSASAISPAVCKETHSSISNLIPNSSSNPIIRFS